MRRKRALCTYFDVEYPFVYVILARTESSGNLPLFIGSLRIPTDIVEQDQNMQHDEL